MNPDVAHCLEKIRAIVGRGEGTRRDLLQLGYNLGRLSELTGLGREPFWDAWKEPVADGDHDAMRAALERLEALLLDVSEEELDR
jgi:hypothetical protein